MLTGATSQPVGQDDSQRFIVFFFESPEPLMLPEGTTWVSVLEDEVDWLRGVMRAPTPDSAPFPQDALDGRDFVSFRFWQGSTQIEPPLPSSELQRVLRDVLPFEDVAASRVGIAGWNEDEEAELVEMGGATSHLEEQEDDDEEEDVSSFLEHSVTIVEAVTPLIPSPRQSDVLEALQKVMAALNEFSRVYRLANKVPMLPVTYETLPASGVYWTTRDPFAPDGGWVDQLELLMFPERLPGRTQHPELNEERLQNLTLYWDVWRRGGPLLPYSERSLDARLALENFGDYANCVVQCQVAIEVLFDTLLQLMLWEENVLPEEAASGAYRDRLHKRIRTQFPHRLGGNWNTKGGGVVGRWGQKLAPLRNRIVHTGYRPTRDEALEGMAIMAELDEFFRDRLVAKRTSYPRTTLMTLGSPGLQRYGVWGGKIRRFAERADEDPNWIHAFNEWRDQFVEARRADQDSDARKPLRYGPWQFWRSRTRRGS